MMHDRFGPPRAAPCAPIAIRAFTPLDQERFIIWSGDRNPIHLASHAGRPGFSNRPIVHGVHAALWALDALYEALPDLPLPASLRVRFDKPIHVGDMASASVVHDDGRKLRLVLMRGEERVTSLHLGFDPRPSPPLAEAADSILSSCEPCRITLAAMQGFRGCVPITAAQKILGGLFPAASRALGRPRIAALACSSVVVGMVCPGPFSLYAGLDLDVTATAHDEVLTVAVRDTDARFRRVVLMVAGGGWGGLLDTLSPLRTDEGAPS